MIPYNGLAWLVALVWGAVGVFVGLRAPGSPAARASLLVGVCVGFALSRFYFGVGAILLTNSVINVIGNTAVGALLAARLEALAEPGGICVSATVHDEVEGKVRASHEDLGEREVKNIPHPIRVYRLRR